MAQFVITIPDAEVPRVVDALCADGRWTAESGMTRGEFARHRIVRYVKAVVRQYEGQQAATTAREQAELAADAIGIS